MCLSCTRQTVVLQCPAGLASRTRSMLPPSRCPPPNLPGSASASPCLVCLETCVANTCFRAEHLAGSAIFSGDKAAPFLRIVARVSGDLKVPDHPEVFEGDSALQGPVNNWRHGADRCDKGWGALFYSGRHWQRQCDSQVHLKLQLLLQLFIRLSDTFYIACSVGN